MGDVGTLIGHLLSLRLERRTGILTVRGGETGTAIFLHGGEIVFADVAQQEAARAGAAPEETLGRRLVRHGKLTEAQYESVVARMGSGAAELRFGEVAVELGFVTTPQVVKVLSDQVRFRVMRIFQGRDELSWQFQSHTESEMVPAAGAPGAALRAAVGNAPPSIEELVLDAVRWIDDDHKNELGLFMALGQRLGVRAEDRSSVARRFALKRDEAELLTRLDGKQKLGEVLSMSGSVDGPAVLTALLLSNALAPIDAQTAPARPPMTPAPPRVLPTPLPPPAPLPPLPPPAPPARSATPQPAMRTATTPQPEADLQRDEEDAGPLSVRTGWWGGQARATPEKADSMAKPPPATRASPSTQSRVASPPPASARNIPAAPPSNPAPESRGRALASAPSHAAPQPTRSSAVMKAVDPKRVPGSNRNLPAVSSPQAKAAAEQEFRGALLHFKAFRYADASRGFMRAAELVPQSAEYKLYARWNHILQKGDPMQVGDRGEAWRLALAAIAVDANSAFAHYVAGAVAQEDGQKPIAHRYLSRAVALDPQLVDAQRRLRIVDRREA